MSKKWTIKQKKNRQEEICARFGELDCRACPVRVRCTHSAVHPRKIVLRPKERYEAIQAARNRQNTKKFQERYAKRYNIEDTISQGVLAFDLRVYRYLCLQKTHLQHLLIAMAMNVVRLFQWQMGFTLFQSRVSRFVALAA